MSSDDENLFYEILRNNFGPLFNEKSDGQFIFCLPPNHVTKYIVKQFGGHQKKMLYFINSHFLRISSYYKDHFVSLYGNTFLRKKHILHTRTGFSKRFTVTILNEEEYLSEAFEPYKVWFLDRCLLDEGEEIENMAKRFSKKQHSINTLSSLEVMQERLRRIDPNVFLGLMKKIIGFNKSYVLMKNCETQAIEKLDLYFNMLLKQYDNIVADSLEITLCIRSVLESGVYKKLISFFRNSSFRKLDTKLYKYCCYLAKHKSQTEIGCPDKFACNQDDAIQELLKIGTFMTVIEKMKCIRRVLDLITDNITKKTEKKKLQKVASLDIFQAQVRKEEVKVVLLTSDEVISILSFVIISAKIPDLISNFQFIKKCQIEDLKTTHYHYSFLNFDASIQYILKLGDEIKSKRKASKSSSLKLKKQNSKSSKKKGDSFDIFFS